MARRAPLIDWRHLQAPSLSEFELITLESFARLPEGFRRMCKGLVIRVEDFPDEEIVEEMDLESEFDILGLYHGVSLAEKSLLDPPSPPDMVFLYRRPILDYWADNEETLGHLISHVLIHEIGHHFGLSDDDMDAIEQAAEI